MRASRVDFFSFFSTMFSKPFHLLSYDPPLLSIPRMQNVIQTYLVPAVSSHVIVQVEGHLTLGPESAANDVLLSFRGTTVNWVR